MEEMNVFNDVLFYYGVGFLGGIFLGYVAKIINALWTSATKFFV